MPDGGLLITGSRGFSGDGGQNLWLVRTDAAGSRMWEKTFKNPDDEKGTALLTFPDGEILILGDATLPHSSVSYATLRRIDGWGNILWERWLGRGMEIYALMAGGGKACFLTGKEIPRNSSSRKAELVVMKIRTNP